MPSLIIYRGDIVVSNGLIAISTLGNKELSEACFASSCSGLLLEEISCSERLFATQANEMLRMKMSI